MSSRAARHRRRRLFRLARLSAGLVGSVCAVTMVAGWRVPAGWGTVGARVNITVNRSGPLEVIPSGEIVSIANMQAGADASGVTRVRNLTDRTLTFRVRVEESTDELDRLLTVEVRADGHAIFHGPIGGLRHEPSEDVVLGPDQTVTIDVHARLGRHAATAYRGRVLDAQLLLRPVGSK